VADLHGITTNSTKARQRQLSLKVSDETIVCTLRIDQNLQQHRVVSLRQHSFLVYLLMHSRADLQGSIIITYNLDCFGLFSKHILTVLTSGHIISVIAVV